MSSYTPWHSQQGDNQIATSQVSRPVSSPPSPAGPFREFRPQRFKGIQKERERIKRKVEFETDVVRAPAFRPQTDTPRPEGHPSRTAKVSAATSESHTSESTERPVASPRQPRRKKLLSWQRRSVYDVFDEDEQDDDVDYHGVHDITGILLPDDKTSRRMPSVRPDDERSSRSSAYDPDEPIVRSESPATSQPPDPLDYAPPARAMNDETLQQEDDELDESIKQESPVPERLPFASYQKRLLEDVNLSELMGGIESSDDFKDRVNVATQEEFEAIGDELAARYCDLIKKIAEGIRKRATTYTETSRSLEDHRGYLQARAESIRKTQEKLKEAGKTMFAEAALMDRGRVC